MEVCAFLEECRASPAPNHNSTAAMKKLSSPSFCWVCNLGQGASGLCEPLRHAGHCDDEGWNRKSTNHRSVDGRDTAITFKSFKCKIYFALSKLKTTETTHEFQISSVWIQNVSLVSSTSTNSQQKASREWHVLHLFDVFSNKHIQTWLTSNPAIGADAGSATFCKPRQAWGVRTALSFLDCRYCRWCWKKER